MRWEFPIVHGNYTEVPIKPGLGIEPDEKALDKRPYKYFDSVLLGFTRSMSKRIRLGSKRLRYITKKNKNRQYAVLSRFEGFTLVSGSGRLVLTGIYLNALMVNIVV